MAVCAVLLVGCGSEPGETDVKEVLLKQFEAAEGKEVAHVQQAELDAMQVIGCNADSTGYRHVAHAAKTLTRKDQYN